MAWPLQLFGALGFTWEMVIKSLLCTHNLHVVASDQTGVASMAASRAAHYNGCQIVTVPADVPKVFALHT